MVAASCCTTSDAGAGNGCAGGACSCAKTYLRRVLEEGAILDEVSDLFNHGVFPIRLDIMNQTLTLAHSRLSHPTHPPRKYCRVNMPQSPWRSVIVIVLSEFDKLHLAGVAAT